MASNIKYLLKSINFDKISFELFFFTIFKFFGTKIPQVHEGHFSLFKIFNVSLKIFFSLLKERRIKWGRKEKKRRKKGKKEIKYI